VVLCLWFLRWCFGVVSVVSAFVVFVVLLLNVVWYIPSFIFQVLYPKVYSPGVYSKLYIPGFIFQVLDCKCYIPRFIFQVYIPSFVFLSLLVWEL
jgi:hypothetical protein